MSTNDNQRCGTCRHFIEYPGEDGACLWGAIKNHLPWWMKPNEWPVDRDDKKQCKLWNALTM